MQQEAISTMSCGSGGVITTNRLIVLKTIASRHLHNQVQVLSFTVKNY